jgi:cyclic pyranopterin phosphate synthase
VTRLLLFARARDAAGGAREIEVEALNAGEAVKVATERFGAEFERLASICSFLIDGDPVARDRLWDTPVGAGTEIAVLPPVSGGGAERVGKKGARMVDVGDKAETQREATAVCTLVASAAVRDALLSGTVPKGDATEAARLAGIMAAKRVPELIPLCHPLRLTSADVSTKPVDGGIEVRATVRGRDRTGFEMEALTACVVAALTLYDMGKSEDPRMRIEGVRLVAKSGGKSGSVRFE